MSSRQFLVGHFQKASFALGLVLGMTATGGYAPAVDAQVLEEVVVTAQKREQDIQDVGIAITAFSGDQLRGLGLTNPDELDMHVPGLMITDFGNSYTSVFTLRGSTQLDFADHHEPPVAVYVDGAYNSFLGAVGQSFYDLERVEVLKGPQGTLFGRNATGGLVHLLTKKPTREWEGYADLQGGENEFMRFEGAVGGPINDVLAMRVSGLFESHDGFIDNLADGDKDLAEKESRNLRGQLLFEPNEDVSFHLQGRWNDEDDVRTIGYHPRSVTLDFPALSGADLFTSTNGISGLLGIPNDPTLIIPAVGQGDGLVRHADPTGATFAAGCAHPLSVGAFFPGGVDCFGTDVVDNDPQTALVDQTGGFDRQYWGVTGTLEWDFGRFQIVNILDYQSLEKFYIEDTDGTPIKSLDFYQYVDAWQFSEEFRVHWETEKTRWVAGAYYLHIEGDYRSGIDLPQGLGFSMDNEYENETDSYAFFLQGEWDFAEQWTAIAGVRWTEDEKDATFSPRCQWRVFGDPDCSALLLPFLGFAGTSVQELGYDLNRSEGDYAMTAELNFRPTDDMLLYAKVTRGNKAGAFNGGTVALYTTPEAEFDGEVLWNYEGGIKSTWFDGRARFNASVFWYDYNDFQTYTQFGPSLKVFNVDSKVLGSELELVTNPWDNWEFMFGASFLDAEVEDMAFGVGQVADVPMTNSPDVSLNGMGRYMWNMFNGNMAAQIDFNWVDDRNLNAIPHPAYIADDYLLANARLSYTTLDGDWQIEFWVKNFTDEEYVPTVFDLATFNGLGIETVGQPRWFGGTVRYTWN